MLSLLPQHHQYVCGLKWAGGGGRGAALFTASYDGSLRRLDVERGVSGESKPSLAFGLGQTSGPIVPNRRSKHMCCTCPLAGPACPPACLALPAELLVSSEEAEYSCMDVTGDGR